ncbi:hypothetical protein TNCV_4677281 [Trichonephila clavipes]|nr:hypothetical protein TNCV_4677281 [Trichonephila clavipes]
MIQNYRRVTLCEISSELGLSQCRVYRFWCAAIFQDSAVKSSAETWLNGQGLYFYQDELYKLVLRFDKCLNRLGDYVEM